MDYEAVEKLVESRNTTSLRQGIRDGTINTSEVSTAVCVIKRRGPLEKLIKDTVINQPWLDAATHLGHYCLRNFPLENNVKKIAAACTHITNYHFTNEDSFNINFRKLKLNPDVSVGGSHRHKFYLEFPEDPNHYSIQLVSLYSKLYNISGSVVREHSWKVINSLIGIYSFYYFHDFFLSRSYKELMQRVINKELLSAPPCS